MGEVSFTRTASDKAVIQSEQFSAISQELPSPHCLHPQSEVREDGFHQGIVCPLKGQAFSIGKCSLAPLPPGQPPAGTPSPSASSWVSPQLVFSKHTSLPRQPQRPGPVVGNFCHYRGLVPRWRALFRPRSDSARASPPRPQILSFVTPSACQGRESLC